MKWFFSLFRNGKNNYSEEKVKTYIYRFGKSVLVDEVFLAWTSNELDKMLKAVKSKTNLIDRHHLLQTIVDKTYKLRTNPEYRKLCIKYSEIHLNEFPQIAKGLEQHGGLPLPRVSTFQYYATVLTEIGQFDTAISVCRKALSFGLHDNTNSGFEGRIKRIEKAREKSA